MNAWSALLEANRRLLPRLDADLRDRHDLTLEWYDVLYQLLQADGSLTMGQLGQRLLIGASSCTRRVDRMAEAGLVLRHRDETDARIVHASLTDQGRAMVRRAGVTHLQSIQHHFGQHLDDETAETIGQALRAIAPDDAC
jgi:DNA-binding MarR family transcriptional regulator